MVVRYRPIVRSDPAPDPMRCEAAIRGRWATEFRQCPNPQKYMALDEGTGDLMNVCRRHRVKP